MRIIDRAKYIIKYCQEYGIDTYTSVKLYDIYSHFINNSKLSDKLLSNKQNAILRYLSLYYEPDVYHNKKEADFSVNDYQNCIWTAWLQGEEKEPEIIKLTISSIKKYANGHDVIVLSDNNIKDFIEVPYEIKNKYDCGIIGKAHYADIVRMMILAKYGGIWLDATILLHEPLNEMAFSLPFFSVGVNDGKSKYVSDHKWIVGILGGCRNSIYTKAISESLVSYWKNHDLPIDYFVFDYIIALLYLNNNSFRQIVKGLPQMKFNSNELKIVINEEYNEENMKRLFVDNQLFYLTYKYEYKKLTSDNRITYYGYLLNSLISR